MAEVDPGDDTRRRFVVRRYAYDPARHERRHQVVATFDNEREFNRFINTRAKELQARRDAGEEVDAREHYSGSVMEPGHLRRQRVARLLRRAVEHGVWPHAPHALDLPTSVSFLTPD